MSGDDRQHEFDDVEAILRDLRDHPETLEQPPADLWDRIAADALDVTDVADPAPPAVADVVDPAPPATSPPPAITAADADVVPISNARRTRILGIVGAAAAAVVLLIAGIVVVTGDDDADPVVAEAELGFDETVYDPLGAGAATNAELVERSDGSFEVRLVDTDLPAPIDDEDLELWLLDDPTSPTDLVSLGLVDPDEPGTYVVPAGYDPSTFFVVDISVEPRDGDAAHSGRTILRGPLQRV